jgi:hypothetical protein
MVPPATAGSSARLFQEQSQRARIIEALAAIANEIATTREVLPALDQIARRTLDLLNANDVAIYLIQDDNVTLKTVTAHGAYRKEILGHTRKLAKAQEMFSERQVRSSTTPARITQSDIPGTRPKKQTQLSSPDFCCKTIV